MEIINGLALAIPYIVSICPHADGWGVALNGGPKAKDTVDGIVMRHWAQTIAEAKSWAAGEIGRRFEEEFGLAPPKLKWENLVCNPPGRDQAKTPAIVQT